LRANGLRIVFELFESNPQLIANRLEAIVAMLPSITAPTVSNLYRTDWFSVESVIAESVVRELIPKLLKARAVGIIEYALNKVI